VSRVAGCNGWGWPSYGYAKGLIQRETSESMKGMGRGDLILSE